MVWRRESLVEPSMMVELNYRVKDLLAAMLHTEVDRLGAREETMV